jgi:hypothetical protein
MKAIGKVALLTFVTVFYVQQSCFAANMVLKLEGDPESYFAVPDDNSFDADMGIAFTVEAWVNPDITSGENMILNKEDVYEIAINNGILQTAVQPVGLGWEWLGTEGEVLAGEWTHVAATWDGEVASTFVNGVYIGSYDKLGDGANNSPDTFKVGRRPRGDDTHSIFTGLIDEIRISKTVRYTDSGFDVPTSGYTADPDTVALYHFDVAIDGVVKDASAVGNDGELISDAVLVADDFLLAAGNPTGDFNEDGTIDLADYNILQANFNMSGGFGDGDMNGDGRISLTDFIRFRVAFHTGPAVGAAVSVPEPGCPALLGVPLLFLLHELRRRGGRDKAKWTFRSEN